MAEKQAKIILSGGANYESPIDNLDNVRRIFAGQIEKIILPDEQETEEESAPVVKRGRKPKEETN